MLIMKGGGGGDRKRVSGGKGGVGGLIQSSHLEYTLRV